MLLSMLGRGGFSEVWKALDLVELREVAVKVRKGRGGRGKRSSYYVLQTENIKLVIFTVSHSYIVVLVLLHVLCVITVRILY